MSPHSLLFVPADSERKLAKAADSGADALILDLEDAVAPERKPAARELARAFLQSPRSAASARLWVRINALNTADSRLDLDHPAALAALSEDLSTREAQAGIGPETTRLIPLRRHNARHRASTRGAAPGRRPERRLSNGGHMKTAEDYAALVAPPAIANDGQRHFGPIPAIGEHSELIRAEFH
jgi:hypothetical protein